MKRRLWTVAALVVCLSAALGWWSYERALEAARIARNRAHRTLNAAIQAESRALATQLGGEFDAPGVSTGGSTADSEFLIRRRIYERPSTQPQQECLVQLIMDHDAWSPVSARAHVAGDQEIAELMKIRLTQTAADLGVQLEFSDRPLMPPETAASFGWRGSEP